MTPDAPALTLPSLRGWVAWLAAVLVVDLVLFATVFDGRLPFNYTYEIRPDQRERLVGLMEEVREEWPDQRILLKAMVAIKFDIGQQAIPTLIEYTHHEDVSMRRFALYALGALGDQYATPAVMDALDDPDPMVIFSATMALGTLGDVRARDELQALLDYPDYRVRASAALNLGLVGPRPSDVEALIAHIEDPHQTVGATIQQVLSDVCQVNPAFLGQSRRLWQEWWETAGREKTDLPTT